MPPKKEKFHPVRSWAPLFVASFNESLEDGAARFSAALAYYAIFAMTPLVIIAISVAGLVFGEEAARGQIYQQIHWLLGEKGATEIQTGSKPERHNKGLIGTIVGLITLLIGASGVFAQPKDAPNSIWGVRLPHARRHPAGLLREYLLSFSMVLGIGFLSSLFRCFSAPPLSGRCLYDRLSVDPGFIVPLPR
jgi:membrane protein